MTKTRRFRYSNDSEFTIISVKFVPTEKPLLADSTRAASTMSLSPITFAPLLTALQVRTIFGLQSMILCASDSAEKPAKTT